MIISHKYKFIFIRVPKTASSSLQFVLGKMCGEDDIVTPILNPPIPKHYARNYAGFEQHISARVIKQKVSSEVWDHYFKFCFERNPYDKIVSTYWYRKYTGKYHDSFRQYCLDCSRGISDFPNGFQLYSLDNKIIVDFIGRYESLNKDFQHVCEKLGLPFDGQIPKEKSKIRQDNGHYSHYYDSETKEIVRKQYAKEIELFGYSFEDKK